MNTIFRKFRYLFVLILVLSLVSVDPAGSSIANNPAQNNPNIVDQNLAPNPSFESGDMSPDSWMHYGGATFTWSSTRAHSGARSICISDAEATSSTEWVSYPHTPAEPSKQYTIGSWSIGDFDREVSMDVEFYDEFDQLISRWSHGMTYNDSFWTYNEMIITSPANAHFISIVLGVNNPGDFTSTEICFDDVSLIRQPVTAVLVKSWGSCSSSGLLWDHLNSNWSDYGDTPVYINYDDPLLCGDSFTYDALAASGADVVILSDPSGYMKYFTPDEISALQQYANEGHNIIGTYLLLFWSGTDNRGLAPIFGLDPGLSYIPISRSSTSYTFLDARSPLFYRLSDPFDSGGYPDTQVPDDGTWSDSDLDGAQYLAITSDLQAAIMVYSPAAYDAIYITSMPEYGGSTQDAQFLYNAIIYPMYLLSLPIILMNQ